MNLILIRHADAGQPLEDPDDDMLRPLSRRGIKQAAYLAEWVEEHLPEDLVVLCSQAIRAKQTAQALQQKAVITPALNPAASFEHYLEAANWPEGKGGKAKSNKSTVVLIGHQPTLGLAASFLLAGQTMPWTIKKGGLWWISRREREDEFQNVLRAVVNQEQLGA